VDVNKILTDEEVYKSFLYKRIVLGSFVAFFSGVFTSMGVYLVSDNRIIFGIVLFVVSLVLLFASIAWGAYKLFEEEKEEEGE